MSVGGDFRRSVVGALSLELGPSCQGGSQSGRDLGMVGGGAGMKGSSRRMITSGKSDVAEAPGWTLGVVDISKKVLGSWDTCHHPDEGQILTNTSGNVDIQKNSQVII